MLSKVGEERFKTSFKAFDNGVRDDSFLRQISISNNFEMLFLKLL
jgi:hypothetical protein